MPKAGAVDPVFSTILGHSGTKTVNRKFFHLHLVSDATGETLNTVARAATAHYADFQPIEHVYALVRSQRQLLRVLQNIEANPGIVLFTIVNPDLRRQLEEECRVLDVPAISILDPIISSLASYLNAESQPRAGAQHAMDAEYFRRIEAMNFTMMHDDGQHTEDLENADVVIVGISRTSKTPTSIYLANRGIKTANVPLVIQVPLPAIVTQLKAPVVVGLVASADPDISDSQEPALVAQGGTGNGLCGQRIHCRGDCLCKEALPQTSMAGD